MNHIAQRRESPLPFTTRDWLWHSALDALRPQMTKATFNNWLADSHILPASSTPAFWVVAVRNEYAYEWLTTRLAPVIERTLVDLLDGKVTVCFVPRTMRNIHYDPLGRSPARISFNVRYGSTAQGARRACRGDEVGAAGRGCGAKGW